MSESLNTFQDKLAENQEQNVKEREKAESDLRAAIKMKYPFTSSVIILLVRILLYHAQQFAILRENQRNLWPGDVRYLVQDEQHAAEPIGHFAGDHPSVRRG